MVSIGLMNMGLAEETVLLERAPKARWRRIRKRVKSARTRREAAYAHKLSQWLSSNEDVSFQVWQLRIFS